MDKKNTDWVYGLKLLAALLVIIHHFALFFYPALISGIPGDARIAGGIEASLSKTPFDIFSWGGNVCVCIFFIMSGFLLSYKFYFSKKEPDLKKTFITRYFKLVIPMLLTSLLYCIVIYTFKFINDKSLCVEILGKTGSYCNTNINIGSIIYQSIIDFFINGNVQVNPVLWTMKGELLGSVAVLSFLTFFGKNKNRKYIYALLVLLLFKSIVFPFLLGMIICDCYANDTFKNFFNKWYIKLLLLVGSFYFFGLTFTNYDTALYKPLHILNLEDPYFFYHVIGSFLIIILIIYSNFLRKILSAKIFKKFPNLSFELYLFHWLIINTVSMILISFFMRYTGYTISFLLSFTISMILIFVISYYCGEYILNITNKYSNKIYNKYFKD